MVKASFKVTDDQISLEMTGHAEYNPGNDIVCAGISALAYCMAGAMDNADIPVEYGMKSGDFYCTATLSGVDKDTRRDAFTILDTIFIGLKQIEATHPDNISVEMDTGL